VKEKTKNSNISLNYKFYNLEIVNLPGFVFEQNQIPKNFKDNCLVENEKLQGQIECLNLKIIDLQGKMANNEIIYYKEKKKQTLKIAKLQEGIAFMKQEKGNLFFNTFK